MSDSVRPQRWQPTRLPRPWDSPGKNSGVGCHFLLQCMKVKVKSLSRVRFLATPWTAAYQAPLSMGFSGQEYWSGVPLPSPFVFYRVGQKARSGFSVKILQKKRTNFWPNHCYAPLRTQGPGSVCWLPRGLSPTKAAHLCLPSPRNLPHVCK